MNQHSIHFLDLPNEILLTILEKLDNIDVLYALLGIDNQRLDILAAEKNFTNNLNLVSTSSCGEISTIASPIVDRFCTDILPRIHLNIKYLILESVSIERILRAARYPNLTHLKLFNFNNEIVSRYFTDSSVLRDIFKYQITDLTLINNNKYNRETALRDYTANVYAYVLTFFENLTHLTIGSSPINRHTSLSLYGLPSITFFSSTLIKLSINVNVFDDCLALLDGRLKQMTTFIAQVNYITDITVSSYKRDDLLNLKCFSLTCYHVIEAYDNQVVPLLRHMLHLEELTLYLCIMNRPTFVDGIHLHNEILVHLPRLHTFTFYICTDNCIDGIMNSLSNDDIQQTFANTKHCQVACIVDYFGRFKATCHVFSLPFKFDRLEKITNNFPSIVFNYVIHLALLDVVSFKHEFFLRIARAFPLLKYLSVRNILPLYWTSDIRRSLDNHSYPIVEYPHLTSLDVNFVDTDYIEQFLNETITRLPCLTELIVKYSQLKTVTENFTRDVTRRNCASIRRLVFVESIGYSKDVHLYFPLLYL